MLVFRGVTGIMFLFLCFIQLQPCIIGLLRGVVIPLIFPNVP